MNEEIFVNDLIQWNNIETYNSIIKRVLWIDEKYSIAYIYDVYAKKGFPEMISISNLKELLQENQASKLNKDPWLRIIQEEELSDKKKQIRDKAWEIISPLIDQEPQIYQRHLRGKLIREIINNYKNNNNGNNLPEKTIYKYLRKFWQRGKIKNALLPDYVNSGGKGKRKKVGEKKRGRPRKYKGYSEIGEGINITEQDRQIFRIAVNKFYRNPKQNSLTTAYKLMIRDYYSQDIIFDDNNLKKITLLPPEKRPTLTQFRYWYDLENNNLKKNISARQSSKTYNLKHRAILGTSNQETIGPGSRFQIDATVADVYLVSKYNRDWIIGRPVIYVIIDVFSRLITGVYVGLEGPSWVGAMMALVNCTSDKALFCKEYGINISKELWPCHHIPDCIIGDRGELIGMSVENIIPSLRIRIENTSSFRADWKGIVERQFKIIHQKVRPFLPGFIDVDFRQRGGKDYRLDARLDIDQFTEIIIELILFHNSHYLSNYNLDEEMIADNINPIPLELWDWGIKNRSGKLRTMDEEIIKLNLMPTSKATITARGIKFKSMHYTCQKAQDEMWFEKARSGLLSSKEKSLRVSYDPRKMNLIYISFPDGRSFEKCYLLDPDERYSNKTIFDIDYLIAYENFNSQVYQQRQLEPEVNLMSKIESITARAMEETAKYQDDSLSNLQKTSNIREYRALEKEKRRQEEAFELKKEEEQDQIMVETKPKSSHQGKQKLSDKKDSASSSSSSSQPNRLELLKRKRQEKLNKSRGDE